MSIPDDLPADLTVADLVHIFGSGECWDETENPSLWTCHPTTTYAWNGDPPSTSSTPVTDPEMLELCNEVEMALKEKADQEWLDSRRDK